MKNFFRGAQSAVRIVTTLALLLAPLCLAATMLRMWVWAMPRVVMPHGVAGYLLIDCPPFSNVAATGLATVKLDNLIGYTVDRVILELGGTTFTKAMITSIRMLANEKPIFESTGSRTDSRMQFRGITANAAYLTLDFSEIRARTIIGQRVGSVDTVSAGINKLSLEVQITGATAPTLTAAAMVSQAPQTDPESAQLIAKVVNKTFNPGGAGEFAFDFNYQRVPGSFVKRVHLSGATVTASRVKKNGIEIFKALNARNNYVQTEFGRTPQANWQVIDFIVDGNLSDALPMGNAQSMEWYVTASGAGNIVMEAELLDRLSNN